MLFLTNNTKAEQDDEDIEVSLSGQLITDSNEIYSSLMPCGTYSFFEQPLLDVGSFDHDVTRIDVSEVQQSTSNTTNKNYGSTTIPSNLKYNTTTKAIPQYITSAPKNTIIDLNCQYNFTNFGTRTLNVLPNEDLSPLQWAPTPSGSHYSTVDEASPNTADYILSETSSYEDKIGFQNITLGYSERITNIQLKLYGRGIKDVGAGDGYHLLTFYFDLGSDTTLFYAGSWSYLIDETYSGLNLTSNDFNSFTLRLVSTIVPLDHQTYVGSVYLILTISNKTYQPEPFKAVQINDFKYQVLGINYTQTFNTSYDQSNSDFSWGDVSAKVSYFFSSDLLVFYDHISGDLIILSQNLSLTFFFWFSGASFQFSVNVSYSSNSWKVPSEISLEINNQDVIDDSYNSGYVLLSTYLTLLVITSSSSNIYFKLNITVDFSFTFDLDIISKSYLKKDFELESDHEIELTEINLDDNLEIKKIYLNNVYRGNSDSCYLSPSVVMYEGNTFYLEVILDEEIYLPLSYIMNTLGSGTANIYLSGISNILTFSNINGNSLYSIPIPQNCKAEYANMSFSNIQILPDYTSNASEDENDYGYNVNGLNYGGEDVQFSSQYYQTNQNGTYNSETNDPSYYQESSVPSNSSFLMANGTKNSDGNLYTINNDYATFKATQYGTSSTFSTNLVPNGDVTIEWHDSDSDSIHYDDVDDYPDTNWLTGDCIKAETDDDAQLDKFNLTNQTISSNITQLAFYFTYLCFSSGVSNDFKVDFWDGIKWLGEKTIVVTQDSSVHYGSETWTTLQINQARLNALQVKLKAPATITANRFIVYSLMVTVSGGTTAYHSNLNFTTTFQYQGKGNSLDSLNSVKLYYSQKTNASILMNCSIWNFNTNKWVVFNSSISTSFSGNVLTLTSDYYNATRHIKLKFYGNNSNSFLFYLDQLCLVVEYSYYDPDFDNVDLLWITDTYMVSQQNFTVFWRAYDGNCTNLVIKETYAGTTITVATISIINNTIQSRTFSNLSITMGFHLISMYFYNIYNNYELWIVNYTIKGQINLGVSYQSPQIIGLDNVVSVSIFSGYSILSVYYDNSTYYICKYSNSSYPVYSYDFNFTIRYNTVTIYDISVLVISEYNDQFWVNITNLAYIKTISIMEFSNIYSRYYQDDSLYITILLKDMINTPISGEQINYDIIDPLGTNIFNGASLTNASGVVVIQLDFDITYEIGFYHLNCSFAGTTDYTGVWKLQSFDLFPIQRSSNSSEINLKVNSQDVINDEIQIFNTNNFTISNYNTSIFDVSIIFKLNYTESIAYSESMPYSFTFSASSYITQLTLDCANLTSFPNNFTDYYFNGLRNTNYQIVGSYFRILDLIGDVFQNTNSFNLGFYYLDTMSVQRTQITNNPRTDSDSVVFEEFLTANRTFAFWYFYNPLNINSYSLTHLRTNTTITDINQTGYRFYFEYSSLAGDQFTNLVDYDWNPDVDYDIEINNGTYTRIKVSYSADLRVNNASIVLDLLDEGCYNENWTLNAIQTSHDFELVIPNINFTTTMQSFYIEGYSSIPFCVVYDYESDQGKTRIAEDSKIDYAGFLQYSKYSKSFLLIKSVRWDCYNVYYGSNVYPVEEISDSLVKIEGDGFDPVIDDSYIHFRTRPFETVDWSFKEYDNRYGIITIKINCLIDVDNVYFEKSFDPEGNHDLILIDDDGLEIEDLSDSGDHEGKLYFKIDKIKAGSYTIKIKVNFQTPEEFFVSFIVVLVLAIAMVGTFYYFKYNEKQLAKIKEFHDNLIKKFEKKLEARKKKKKTKMKEVQEIQIKKGKIYAK